MYGPHDAHLCRAFPAFCMFCYFIASRLNRDVRCWGWWMRRLVLILIGTSCATIQKWARDYYTRWKRTKIIVFVLWCVSLDRGV